jgi:23S rRNA pseudouridine1911/1915/1917 synthase
MKSQPEIIYEDNHLLVVVKPENLPVQADQSGDPDLLTLLKADLKLRYQKPGNVFVGMVHRLDRPVGGVMVFAKTSKAAARLSEQIRVHEFQKLVKVNLLTGRSHQIRAQLAALGHPLYGDQKYGAGVNRPGEQIALWATYLAFKHPTKMEQLEFVSQPPAQYPWNRFAIALR